MNKKSGFKYIYLIGAIILTLAIILLAMSFGHIYPFGNKTIIYHDMIYQYFDLFKWFKDVLHGQARLDYSFSKGFGEGTISLFAYYLSSPFNLILAFAKDNTIILFITIITILKLIACSVAMYIYLGRRYGIYNMFGMLLSVAYAMMEYNVQQISNLMWIDAAIWLPIVCLGLYYLVTQKKYKLYVISLGIAIISNWYAGFMICLFAIFYYGLECIIHKKKDVHFVFIGASLLAGMLSAILFVPQTFQMLMQGSSSPLSGWPVFCVGPIGAWNDIFLNDHALTLEEINPPIFIGAFPIVLIISGLIDKSIKWREKLIFVIAILIGMLALIFQTLSRVFNIMHVPNSHYFRHAFLFSFLMISFAGFLSIGYKKINWKSVCISGSILILLQCLSNAFANKMPLWVMFVGIFEIIIAMIVLIAIIYLKKPALIASVICIFLILMPIEHVIDWVFQFERYNMDIADVTKYEEAKRNDIDKLYELDSSIYRLETTGTRYATSAYSTCQIEAMGFGYHGISSYASTVSQALEEFMISIGNVCDKKLTVFDSIPLMDSIFGLKYAISDRDLPGYELIAECDDGKRIYRNQNALSIGYRIDNTEPEAFSNNPFENEEQFMSDILGYDRSVYVDNIIELTQEDGHLYTLTTCATGPVYIYIEGAGNDYSFQANGRTESIAFYNNNIRYVGDYEEGESIDVSVSTGKENIVLYSATLDMTKLEATLDEIAKQTLDVSIMEDGHILGEYISNSDSNETIMLTVPYELGWTIKINGKKVPYNSYRGAFITFDVPPGVNTIEMRYHVPLLWLGALLSLICIIILLKPEKKVL